MAAVSPVRDDKPGMSREGLDVHDLRTIHRSTVSPIPYDATLEHNRERSLSSIGIQAFCLGNAFAIGLIFSVQLGHHLIWRVFAFLACLSLFHFLEYWTTARFNTPAVKADSFLLFNNGAAYNIANALAFSEILLSLLFFDSYAHWATSIQSKSAGLVLVAIGQIVRSVAMAQAGTNFNHIQQKTHKEGHVLVTSGIYAWLRHPSYFGFYYWAIGTQLLVGNKVSAIAYALVLWNFFSRRISAEERQLFGFFGEDYSAYRSRTRTGIPFIG